MTWTTSISLKAANKIFEVIDVTFEDNKVEGVYTANHPVKGVIRRATLSTCCQAVLQEWVTINVMPPRPKPYFPEGTVPPLEQNE